MFYGKFDGEKGKQFKDALEYFRTMFSRVYANDNLITFNRNLTFLNNDPKFLDAFTRHAQSTQEKSLAWRLHTLCWAAKHCLKVPGDFVECGVYRGFSFSVLTDYLDFENVKKDLYLYDTYEGIPEAYNSENRSNAVYQKDNDILGHVTRTFAKYKNVKIVKGIVPDSFEQTCPEKISFLHIDMNSSKSEIAALEKLFDRVSVGGIILFDDFGWLGYDKQTTAEIEFMAQRNHNLLELPTGQGLMIKYF